MLKRRDFSWLWFLAIGALVGLYGVYWKIVHDQAIVIMGDQVEGWRAAGYDIDWSSMESGGFPFKVELVFSDPAVASPADAEPWSWRGETLRVSLRPWALTSLTIAPRGAHSMTTRDYGVVDAEAENFKMRVTSDAIGLRTVTITSGYIAAVRRLNGETLCAVSSISIYLERMADDAGLYQLIGQAADPEWTAANGAAPVSISLQAALSEADVLGAHRDLDARAISAWAQAGGRITVDDARLDWDDASIGASADLTVDRNGQWNGAVTLTSSSPSTALGKLAALGAMAPSEARQIGAAAEVLAALGQDSIPITVRDGEVFGLGFRIGRTPRAF